MVESRSISELLVTAKAGDRRRRMRPELRDQLGVDGLVNDTFGRAFASFALFTGEDEDACFAWLAGIAKNVVLEEIEQLGRGRAFQIAGEPAEKLGLASLPKGVSWGVLIGGGFLSGIGFTMALFISSLALEGANLDVAKVGILVASAIAAILGLATLFALLPKSPPSSS